MRITGGAFVALLGVVLLASCALTPPVLGGRAGEAPEPGGYSEAGLATLLVVDDPEAESTVGDLATYRADAPESPCPGVPLLIPGEDVSAGSIAISPPLFRDRPGADLVVTQAARLFGSSAEAVAFLTDLRADRAGCPAIEVVEGDFAVDAVGLRAEEAGRTTTEWILVHANVAISLSASVRDDGDARDLHALAEEYAATLTDG